MKLDQSLSCFNCNPKLWIALSCFILLTGCATLFGTAERHFQLLAPNTLEQSSTVLLKLTSQMNGDSHHWEAVLNTDVDKIYLVILGPLGQRLATLNFDNQQMTVVRNSPIPFDISLEKLLKELQMTFWPLTTLNAGKSNQDWNFEENKHVRFVYYKHQLVAEIHRHSSSTWNGEFNYISKISDYQLSIQSSLMD